MSNIDDKLDKIINILDNLQLRIDLLESRQNITTQNCSRMDSHIDFVEETYNKLCNPIAYIAGHKLKSIK